MSQICPTIVDNSTMSIRERLYPRERELSVLVRHCSDARYVWNLALEQRNLWVRGRSQRVTYDTQANELAQARKETWLKGGSAAIQHQAFRQRLTDKATNATTPVEIITINPVYTSMCCSKCGHTDKRNRKSQAIFCCIACRYTNNADVNAAKNIISTAVGHTVFRRGGISHARSNKTQHSDPVKRQPAEVA